VFYNIFAFIRFILLGIDFVVFTVVMYVLTFLPKVFLDKFYPRLFRAWCWSFIRALGIDLKLHQKNHVAIPKQYILVANHPSAFEDIGIPALFDVFSLAKIEVRDWFMVGRMSWAAGTLYVHRESRESRKEAAQALLETVSAGRNVALYPEGGCKGRRIYERFLYGAFDASIKSGIPILPVFLHYEAQQDFEWQPPYTLLHKLWHFIRLQNNRVNYYVYDAIYPAQFEDKESFTNHVHSMYLELQKRYLD